MTREEQIIIAAKNHGSSFDNFICGAEWADKTRLQEVLKWLEDAVMDDADGCGHPIVSFIGFDNKEQMIQAFKERFSLS